MRVIKIGKCLEIRDIEAINHAKIALENLKQKNSSSRRGFYMVGAVGLEPTTRPL